MSIKIGKNETKEHSIGADNPFDFGSDNTKEVISNKKIAEQINVATNIEELFVGANDSVKLKNRFKEKNVDKKNLSGFLEVIKQKFTQKFTQKHTTSTINTKETDFNRGMSGINKENSEEDIKQMGFLFNKQTKKLPLIGALSVRNQYKVIGIIALLSLMGIAAGVVLQNQAIEKRNAMLHLIANMFANYKVLNFYVLNLTDGNKNYFMETQKQWEVIELQYKEFSIFKNQFIGGDYKKIKEQAGKIDFEHNKLRTIFMLKPQKEILVRNIWEDFRATQTAIKEVVEAVDEMGKMQIKINTQDPSMLNIFILNGLLRDLTEIFKGFESQHNISKEAILEAREIKGRIQGLASNIATSGTKGDVVATGTQDILKAHAEFINKWTIGFARVDRTLQILPKLIQLNGIGLEAAQSLSNIEASSGLIYGSISNAILRDKILADFILLISIILIITAVVIAVTIHNFEKESFITKEEAKNNANQSSILRLLNEIMPLQDGNLTRETTVDEGITGAIADSINATILSLRALVSKIRDASLSMHKKTQEVNSISMDMLRAAEEQATSVSETGQSILGITSAIKQIAQKTLETSKIAKESSNLSSKGAQKVFESITSMQTISNNMNETVLLMKKVSESSKQISDIVGLLSDITEETNILALNATVQAAKAGDAGKGFKIVSDSIQELADKAAGATRRVGALIVAVQTDIQSVGVSIEKTTVEVGKGVGLSENAGEVLSIIKSVSVELSRVVEEVSVDALKHATVSEKISENVKLILETTKKNKESTENTTKAIAEIANVSNELGESVHSFTV